MGWGELFRATTPYEEEIDTLRAKLAFVEHQLDVAVSERDHWKANHDNQVRLKRESQLRVRHCIEDMQIARDAMRAAGVTPPLSRLLDF